MSDPFFAATDAIYQTMARAAHYTKAGSVETIDVSVIVSYDMTQWGDAVNFSNGSAIIAVRKSQVPERPRRGDAWTLETGQAFITDRVMFSDEYEHRVMVAEYVVD